MGVVWSCNAKANVPRETLKVLKDNGLRLLLVGYESGNQQILHNIKKGTAASTVAKKFTRDCHELGIKIHGTFILGLPGETQADDPGDDPLRDGAEPAYACRCRWRRRIRVRSCIPPGGREQMAGRGERGAGGMTTASRLRR